MSGTTPSDSPRPGFDVRLREAMELRKFSADSLCEATNGAINPRTIFRWLSGESQPGIGAMRVLCPALRVSSDWLLGISDTR